LRGNNCLKAFGPFRVPLVRRHHLRTTERRGIIGDIGQRGEGKWLRSAFPTAVCLLFPRRQLSPFPTGHHHCTNRERGGGGGRADRGDATAPGGAHRAQDRCPGAVPLAIPSLHSTQQSWPSRPRSGPDRARALSISSLHVAAADSTNIAAAHLVPTEK
jgi:hypothetical protein